MESVRKEGKRKRIGIVRYQHRKSHVCGGGFPHFVACFERNDWSVKQIRNNGERIIVVWIIQLVLLLCSGVSFVAIFPWVKSATDDDDNFAFMMTGGNGFGGGGGGE